MIIIPLKALVQVKSLFARPADVGGLEESLRQFLENGLPIAANSSGVTEGALRAFLERMETLLHSTEPGIQQWVIRWVFEDFIRHNRLPRSWRSQVLSKIRHFQEPWLAYPLAEWVAVASEEQVHEALTWLSELDYSESPQERIFAIHTLLNRFIQGNVQEDIVLEALRRLEQYRNEVTDLVLNCFPARMADHNYRIIALLGQIGRYRVIKPLISFAREYPEYLRAVMKALAKFDYPEVDQFYLTCLSPDYRGTPLVIIEAVKQVRKRRLRKAVPLIEALFPLETPTALLNRAVNGEMAITMASFGAYMWGREKLLSEMVLNGITAKYLKAIDILALEEAVPLLKALMLMPETPEIVAIQVQAYRICEQLLLKRQVEQY